MPFNFKNDNSQVLFNTGAALLGNQLPDRDRADFANVANGISQILQNRFQAQQFDDFKNNEMAAFLQQSAAFGESLGLIEDPNKKVQALMDYKDRVMMPFMTTAASKYGKNEQIMKVAQTVFEHGPKLKDYLDAGDQVNKTRQLDIDQQNADTARMEAQNRGKQLGLEIEREQPIDPAMPGAMILKKLRTMNPNESQAIDEDTFNMVASREAEARRAQYDPSRRQQFGNFRQSMKDGNGNMIEGDIDRAKSLLAESPEKLNRILEFGRGVRKVGIDTMNEKFAGQYDDVAPYFSGTLKTPSPIKMKGQIPDKTIAGVLIGVPSGELPVLPDGTPVQSIDDVIKYVKTSQDPADMGDRFVSAMAASVRVEGNTLIDMTGDKPKRIDIVPGDYDGNRKKLRSAFTAGYRKLVTDELVSDDKNSLTTRTKMNQLGDAAIDQYLPTWSDHYLGGAQVRPPRQINRGAVPNTKSNLLMRTLGGLFE